jgi:hypothetical protein
MIVGLPNPTAERRNGGRIHIEAKRTMRNGHSEEELEQVVFELMDIIGKKLENNDYSIECLSDVEKTVLFASEMELEVKNGGIHP